MVSVPTLRLRAGSEVNAPLPLKTKTPVGLTVMPLGALLLTAWPSRPTTAVLQVVSEALQVLAAAACCATA
jgi:hypothetical protein